MISILPIGDAHVETQEDVSRFELLWPVIRDHRPDHILLMGDFLTLDALSAWDKDKRKKMEGRRYAHEIQLGNEALDWIHEHIDRVRETDRRRKKPLYSPTLTFIEGNHEDRLTRYLDYDPTFEGQVGIRKDLKLDERGWFWVPYGEYTYINDIGFTHIPFNKARPVGGLDVTRKVQQVTVKSCVFGHTHELHTSNRHVEGMDHLQQTLNVGCFFEGKPDYAIRCVTNYWVGVVLLNSYKPGRFDFTTFSLGSLKRME